VLFHHELLKDMCAKLQQGFVSEEEFMEETLSFTICNLYCQASLIINLIGRLIITKQTVWKQLVTEESSVNAASLN